ncbi:MAG: PH domain-containing protein [candidate division Zixibacteria bacterium]|nr:PH domain-containing protein [Candidatus Tariuqbacter arcticus]
MEPIATKPEKEQRTLWILEWIMTFLLTLACGLAAAFLLEYPANLIIGLICAAFAVCLILNLIWIPAFYKSLEYIIGDDSVRAKKGVFWRKQVNVPYTKITNVDVTQGPVQRIFDIGTIHLQTAGASGAQTTSAELKMWGIRDLESVKDAIMDRVKAISTPQLAATAEKASDETVPAILKQILSELTAIREVIGRK